jgi:hypothetical protein
MICLLSEEYSTKKDYDVEPWEHLAHTVRAARIPGEHNTCISRHVGDLAACINRMIVSETL